MWVYGNHYQPKCVAIPFSATYQSVKIHFSFFFFEEKKILFIYLVLEKGREGGRGRETLKCERNIDQFSFALHQPGTWPATQACALTGFEPVPFWCHDNKNNADFLFKVIKTGTEPNIFLKTA